MSTGIRRPYAIMSVEAEQWRARMAPCCTRIEIAGSVRRQKADIGDLEIVCIADGDRLTRYLNLQIESGAIRHVEAGPKKTRRWGEKLKSFNYDSGDGLAQVDLFITTPTELGYTFMVRTGSGGFSNRMVTPVGTRTHDGLPGLMPARFKCEKCRVYDRGVLCDTPDEQDIFRLFGMPTVPPIQRTDDYGMTPEVYAQLVKPQPSTANPQSIHSPAAVSRWHMAKDADWLRTELDKASRAKDPEQARAAQLIAEFLDGGNIDTATLGKALWAIGGPVQYSMDWSRA